MPYIGETVKEAFEDLKRVQPDLVLTHTRDDRHQDHRLACELTWNTFRDHLILEYEVPKWDGDLGRPNLYVPLERGRRRATSSTSCFGTSRPRRGSTGTTPRRSAGSCASAGSSAPRPRGTPRRSTLPRSSSRRRAEAAMRVLVTGSHGYIGSVLAPELVAAPATTSSGSTRATTRAATSEATSRACRRPCNGRPRRHRGGPRGVRRGRPPGGAVERPDRRPQRAVDVRHQPRRDARRRAGGEGGRRRAVRLRFVVLDVRRVGRGRPARRERAAPPADGLRRVEGAGGGGPGRARRIDEFVVVSMRNATVYGASPRLRLDIVLNNLAGWAHTTGRIRLLSDGRSWRPLDPRPRPVARGARHARGARRARRAARRSTSARPSRTT